MLRNLFGIGILLFVIIFILHLSDVGRPPINEYISDFLSNIKLEGASIESWSVYKNYHDIRGLHRVLIKVKVPEGGTFPKDLRRYAHRGYVHQDVNGYYNINIFVAKGFPFGWKVITIDEIY
ncbi:MAG: hypothetical protein H0Z39_11675 [Peptococcaceae bacterium]|nr:hypothetical protein [Peptococcaceae bacterium]